MLTSKALVCVLGIFLAVCTTAQPKKTKKPGCKEVVKKLIERPPSFTRIPVRKSKSESRMYAKVKYECTNKAVLENGEKWTVRQCKNGTLLGKKPVCKPISCGQPDPVAHANFTGNSFIAGSKIYYECQPGYRMQGRRYRRCRRNGRWSRKPRCELITCPVGDSLKLTNGIINTTDERFRNGTLLLFECNEGYDLIGPDIMICLENGWTPLPRRRPYCRKISCPDPGRPDNGRRIGNNFAIGKHVTFACQSGLILRGSRVRTCQSNRMWSGSVAVCDDGASDCPDPGVPVSGFKKGNRYNFGAEVEFSCRPGFVLVGSAKRRCQANGKWTGSEAKCMADFEYMIKDVNSTAYQLKRNIDTMLEYTCSGMNSTCNLTEVDMRARAIELNEAGGLDVVFVFDASSSIKMDDFRLGLDFSIELVKLLGTSWKPGGTHVAAITYGTESHLEFNLGDAGALTAKSVIAKIGKIKRSGGGTASRLALDTTIRQVVPFTREGSQKALFFITDGHSNIGGSPRKAAKILKDKGFQIYAIGVGKKVRRRELMEIASEPEDEYVISVRKYKQLLSAVKKAVHIKIDYSPCGESQTNLRARIVGGNEAGHGTWPWQVGIYRFDHSGNQMQICGGALINREWVLTAAHCFYKTNPITKRREKDIVFPEGYVLKVGDNHLLIKEPTQQDLVGKDIILHPNYKDAPDFENDIALVRLSEAVKLGPFVRTVCLPKKGENLLEPKKYGVVPGWGVIEELKVGQRLNKNTKRAKVLRHSAFEIQPNDVCDRSTRHNFNATVTFCAGDGKGGNDTCHGDSGGSFVREFRREGKYRWVSAGIVSWGEGCGQKDKYGFYTRVEPYVHWIIKTAIPKGDK
uniref:C3/C5 convertase n=2 Tax=Nematostella vectensis TaxID=45351 RepID=B9X084_NEMVE|nr:complement factor B precursor [Nematostella vectensis]